MYIETKVTLGSSSPGVTLAGTLCAPADGTVHAAVLLPGSGPQDRDESIAGQRPLAILAQRLAERGVVTLRCDDRGVGESGGDYLAIDADTLIADIACQVAFLRQHDRAADQPVSLIGHSQGALFAFRFAERDSAIHSVVALAGVVSPGMTFMMRQREMSAHDVGLGEDGVDVFLHQSRALFDLIERQPDEHLRRAAVRAMVEAQVEGMTDDEVPDFGSVADYVEFAVADAMEWEVRDLLLSKSGEHLQASLCPVLCLWGALDRQVDGLAEHRALESLKRTAPKWGLVLPGMNHLFQNCDSGVIENYEIEGLPMCEPVPSIVAHWLKHGELPSRVL